MKRRSIQHSDKVVMLSIFAVLLLYVLNYIGVKNIETKASPVGGYFHLYMLQATLTELIFCFTLWWKAERLGACIYTKIAVYCYGGIILISLWYITIGMKYYSTLLYIQYVLAGGVLAMFISFIINFIKTCIGKK